MTPLRMSVFVCSLLIAVLDSVRADDPITLDLTKNGQPAATIVLAEKPTRAAQLAAAELQEHVHKISGAILPMITDAVNVQGLRILVGESKATRAIGLKNADFKPQEYLIRFQPDALVLMGRDKEDYTKVAYRDQDGLSLPDIWDEQGTCYAVYDFLERHCQVRWYLPTDLGTVYPEAKTLRVSGSQVRRAPSMECRSILHWINRAGVTGWYRYPSDMIGTVFGGPTKVLMAWREQLLYGLRLRHGGKETPPGGHPFYGYYGRFWKKGCNGCKPEYFEGSHPEFFAQGYNDPVPPQMCYTSPEFINQVVKDARDFFDGKKQNSDNHEGSVGRNYYGLGAMDNCSYCKCARCNAIIRKTVPPGSSQYDNEQSVSDYFFGFVNRVAREVKKTHPDKMLITMSYNAYAQLPHEPLEPNVAIVWVLGASSRRAWHTAEREKYRKIQEDWVRQSKERPKYVWLHWLFPVSQATYANPPWKPFPGFAAHKIVDEMRRYNEEGVRGMYIQTSEAGPWCQKLPVWDQLEVYLAAHLADDPSQDGNRLIDEFFDRYYGGAAKPMKAFYELAEEVHCNPNNYPEGVADQTPYIAWECLGTEPRMDKLARMMAEAKAACRNETECRRVELFDRCIWQVMCKGKKQYMEIRAKANATMQSAKAPCVAAPPEEDARKLDWQKAGVLANWSSFDGKPTTRKIEARIAHDGENLYLRLQEQTDTKKLISNAPHWSGDGWELFVARRAAPAESYRHIGINAKGLFADLSENLVDQGLVHESGARVWSDTSSPNCWSVFAAIPINKLLAGADKAKPGDSVCLNIIRTTNGRVDDAAMWVSTMTSSFHELDRLGTVALEDRGGH